MIENPLAASGGVQFAFGKEAVTLKLSSLRFGTPLPPSALKGQKYYQVLASVATVGLVEPVIAVADKDSAESYRVLDGRLRVEALRSLNKEDVLCLLTVDDESYTYNKHISRLTQAQDGRMIAKAIARGVPRDRLAAVLGIAPNTVKRRAMMLDGICREVQAMLADKVCPGTTFAALKSMRPTRQIEAAELMCSQGNFASSFAKAILAATPPELLEAKHSKRRKDTGDLAAQLSRLEKELATLQSQVGAIEEDYGIEHLHLTVAASYIASLMRNEAVNNWLIEQYPEYSYQFQAVANEVEAATEPRPPLKLPFKRRPLPAT